MPSRCPTCGQDLDADPERGPARCPACALPLRIGPHLVEAAVRRGGMGSVYRGRHATLGTRVALKGIRSDVEHGVAELRERLIREARLTARIDHPGAVRIHDVHVLDDELFLVMEWIEGETLREVLARGPLPWERAVDWALELCAVLASAHAAGVVHRDVKPENVMLDGAERVRVLDFGIARALHDETRLTRTGELVGTPEYMAPEQLLESPEEIDPRCDVHAVGLLLHEMLTGRSPFAGTNLFQVLKLVESFVPPPPSAARRDVPAALDRVIASALEKERADRPPDVRALEHALRAVRAQHGTAQRRRTPRGRLVPFAATAALAAWLGWLAAPAVAPPTDAPRGGPWDAVLRDLEGDGAAPARAELEAFVRAVREPRGLRERVARGRALRRLGRAREAVETLAAASAAGANGARRELLLAWHEAHGPTAGVLPAEPVWLHAAPRPPWETRASDADADPLVRAALALATDRPEDVARLLAGSRGRDAEFLRGLAAWRLGDRAAYAAWRDATAITGDGDPPFALLVALDDDARLTDAVATFDRRDPERALLELVLAHRRDDERAARAALERAILCGAEVDGLVLHAALRVARAARGRLPAREARALLDELEGLSPGVHPLLAPAIVQLHLTLGETESAERALLDLPTAPDRALAALQAWRDANLRAAPEPLLERGLALVGVGRLDEAGATLHAFLEADPDAGAAPGERDRARQALVLCLIAGRETPRAADVRAQVHALVAAGSSCEELRAGIDHHDVDPARRDWLRSLLAADEALRPLVPLLLGGPGDG